MSHFYRYITPLFYDEKKHKVSVPPHGGVCLRVQPKGDILQVSFSICPETDVFDKDVAKKIVDTRFENGFIEEIRSSSMAANVIALAFIDHVNSREAVNVIGSLFGHGHEVYPFTETQRARDALVRIRKTHEGVWAREKMEHDIRMAMNIKDSYEKRSKE